MDNSSVTLVLVLLCGLVIFSCCLQSSSACEPFESCNDLPWNLVFLQKSAVKYLQFSKNISVSNIFQNDAHHPVGLTANVRENLVYWTDSDKNGFPAIYRSRLKVTPNIFPDIFVDAGIYDPQGISCDWITGNIYFADSKAKQITVCSTITPTRCAKVLKEESGGTPYAIALDPNKGLLFWTVTEVQPAIKRVGMDGYLPVSLVSTNIKLPNALAVDGEKVFWTDNEEYTIECSKYDGSDRKIIVKGVRSLGFGMLGDSLYWSNEEELRTVLRKVNKNTGENMTRIMPEYFRSATEVNILDFSVIQVSAQPIVRHNSCKSKGCSHICVLSESSNAQCLCPVGFIKNVTKCLVDSAQPKIFVAQNATLLYMQVDTIGTKIFQEIPLPSEIKNIDALVFNPVNGSVIIYDGTSKKIFNFNLESNIVDVLVDKNLSGVVSIDIDYVTQNLFWLDAVKQEVEIFSLRRGMRRVLYKNVKNGHQIISDLGTLHVAKTFYTGKQEIHAIYMVRPTTDELLKTFDAGLLPVQMTFDRSTNMLLIASSNGSYVTIQSEYSSYQKHISLSLGLNGGRVEALKKVGNRLYWLDQSNQMKVLTLEEVLDGKYLLEAITINDDKMNNRTKKMITVYPGNVFLDQIMENLEYNFCSYKNRFMCPHICVPHANDSSGQCWCKIGYKHEDMHPFLFSEYSKCVKSNSTGEIFDYLNAILEASDHADNETDEKNITETGGFVWSYLVFSLTIVFLVCIIGYMAWYWN